MAPTPRTHSTSTGVVIALPAARAAASLLAPPLPELARLLGAVRHRPATVAVARYTGNIFTTAARAVAMDEGPCSNAGAYGRTDRDLVRYTFSGRRGQLGSPTRGDVDSFLSGKEARLGEALGRPLPDRLEWTWRQWPAANCAYSQHHGRFLDQIATATRPLAGRMSLADDYLLGESLEACCRSGKAAARAQIEGILSSGRG